MSTDEGREPTLIVSAWGATPEQAERIFTAAMDAAFEAAGDVDISGSARLSAIQGPMRPTLAAVAPAEAVMRHASKA